MVSIPNFILIVQENLKTEYVPGYIDKYTLDKLLKKGKL